MSEGSTRRRARHPQHADTHREGGGVPGVPSAAPDAPGSGAPGSDVPGPDATEQEGVRLDVALVRRGLARSRGQARELILEGAVRVDGAPVRKAASTVVAEQPVTLVREVAPWVSRAAYKLLEALDVFGAQGLRAEGRRCIDVGASTGGFTQALLSRGAAHVVALDVGHGQLVPQLSADPRVTERSGTNVRDLDPGEVGGPADLVVVDLSFISLRSVLAALAALTRPDGDVVVLVKPQFEVGRTRLGKGGLVRDARDRAQAVTDVVEAAAAVGLHPRGLAASPIRGTTGNAEYLLWLTPAARGALTPEDIATTATALAGREPS